MKTLVVPEGGELPPEEELEAAAAAEAAAAEEAAAASEQAAVELAEVLEHEDAPAEEADGEPGGGGRRRARLRGRAGAGDEAAVETPEDGPAWSPHLPSNRRPQSTDVENFCGRLWNCA